MPKLISDEILETVGVVEMLKGDKNITTQI